jgi:hypothetical protein
MKRTKEDERWALRLENGKRILQEAADRRRTNPSRYTGDGYLKPICAPGEHSQFMGSAKCEICGVVIDE